MNEMTLPSRQRIRNSNPGDLRPSSLPLSHGYSPQYWIFTSEQGRNILFLWKLNASAGFKPAISDFQSRQVKPLHQGPRQAWMVIYALLIESYDTSNKWLDRAQISQLGSKLRLQLKITVFYLDAEKYSFLIGIWELIPIRRWDKQFHEKCAGSPI